MISASSSLSIETRVAGQSDASVIQTLLDRAARPSVRNWPWRAHLGQDVFRLALVDGWPVGAFLAWPDAGPVAWARLAVLDRWVDTGRWLDAILSPVARSLRRLGARALAWIDVGGWAGPALAGRGFYRPSQLITLRKTDRRLPAPAASDVRVRFARPDDMPAVVAVDHAAFGLAWWLSPSTLDLLRRRSDCFLIAEQAGTCVGYAEARVMQNTGHVGRLAVAPHLGGQGVGQQLLVHILTCLWRQGVGEVTLNTQVDNVRSQRLYHHSGFRLYGQKIDVWERRL